LSGKGTNKAKPLLIRDRKKKKESHIEGKRNSNSKNRDFKVTVIRFTSSSKWEEAVS